MMNTQATKELAVLKEAVQNAATSRERIAAMNILAREQWAHGMSTSLATAEQARQLAADSGSAMCLAQSLCTEGYLCYQQSQKARAQARLTEALALIQSHADLEGRTALEAECRHFLGLVHYGNSEFEPALGQFLQAQALYQDAGNGAGLAHIFNDLGNLYSDMGDSAGALSSYCDSLERRRARGDRRGVACSLNNIGIIYGEMQDEAQALLSYEQCLTAARETKYVRLEMRCLANLAQTYAGLSRWEEAVEASRSALELAREGGHRDNEVLALSSWADTYRLSGQPQRAVTLYQQAREVVLEVGNPRHECEINVSLGECFLALDQCSDAQSAFTSCAELAAAVDFKQNAFRAYLGLSEVCRKQGNFEQALEFYQKFHTVQQDVLKDSSENRTKALLIQMQVEQVRSGAEIDRLRSVELAAANHALQAQAELLEAQGEELRAQADELQRQAAEDGLTGLANRRHLEGWLAPQFDQARRTRCPLTVVMADVDHFKQINDRFGHQIGDEVLMSVAMLLRQVCRATDLAVRYGGEEFVLILPGTDVVQANSVCERLRSAVEHHCWGTVCADLAVTISIGLSGDENAPSHERLLGLADAQLYAAKHAGRNRICFASGA